MNLATSYMGLKLKNPLIVGSCGFTQSVESVTRCAEAGAGAVVLKSIFEEQIKAEVRGVVDSSDSANWHPEAEAYIERFGREDAVSDYLRLIREAKEAVSIPLIASINCVTAGSWTEFAKRIEQAGADALELNVFVLPSDPRRDGKENERICFEIARAVDSEISIPFSLKLGSYFSGLSQMVVRLSHSGASGLVLFNRFCRLDFDIEELRVVAAEKLSDPGEIVVPLRWISILSGQVACDLAATTGIHDGSGVVKQLLAGAAAVQICSALYKRGVDCIGEILAETAEWMARHGHSSIADFRGKLSQQQSENPAAYERVQFMKAYGSED